MEKLFVAVGLLVCALLSPFIETVASASGSQPNSPFRGVQNYQIYYNAPNEKIIQDMMKYDLVIIEPYHYSREQIKTIKSKGTIVLGYISTMEVADWNTALKAKLKEEDYYWRNGKKVFYPEWSSYLMDITSPHYQQVLHEEIKNQIVAKDFDGIFLDTVGDIDNEHSNNPVVLKAQQNGMASFLKSVKEAHNNIPMLQNWGFDTLKTATAPYVNGIMWENFDHSNIANDLWAQNSIKQLQSIQQTYPIEVFTVAFEEGQKSKEMSRQSGFIHYYESESFDQWSYVDLPDKQLSTPVVAAPVPAITKDLKSVNRYKIFYGAPNEKIIEEMKSYDLVILEPKFYKKEQISRIQLNGTVVLAYTSVMKAPGWDKQLMAKFIKQDFQWKNGNKIHYSQENSYLMNISSSHYQDVLLKEMESQVFAKGFNGVFLDSIGEIEVQNANNKAAMVKQQQNLVSFLKKVKAKNSKTLLVQSAGFETLKSSTFPYMDGILWAAFNYSGVHKNAWAQNVVKDLKQLNQKRSIQVFTVSTAEGESSRKLAQNYGFVPYHSQSNFMRW